MRGKLFLFFSLLILSELPALAQPKTVVSGPMLGHVDLRTAKIWFEASPGTQTAAIRYWKKTEPRNFHIKAIPAASNADFSTLQTELTGLDINTSYVYEIWINGLNTRKGGEFTTRCNK